MKPGTKLQHRVMELSKQLRPITDEQQQWGLFNCLKHVAYRNKTKTQCLDCGHVWPTQNNALLLMIIAETVVTCPCCDVKLAVKDTRDRNYGQREFYSILDVVEDFQVIRIFEIRSTHKAGTKATLAMQEIVVQWLLPNGKFEIIAKNRGGMCWYNDAFTGPMEIRPKRIFADKYNIYPTGIYPKIKCLPVYKRNGFKGKFHGLVPFDLLSKISNDNIAETLLKTKQYSLLQARTGEKSLSVSGNWDSVKICIRSKYLVKDAVTWLDHLNLLSQFGKDLRSPKYVCPADLKTEHRKLVAKKTEIDTRNRYTGWLLKMGQDRDTLKNLSAAGLKAIYDRIMNERNEAQRLAQLEKQKQQAEKDEAAYQAAKGAYFGIVITDGPITIKVLESLTEFLAEAEAHKHCVFTNGYYKQKDSLIFCAQVDGKPVETVELSLSKMKIVQSRGLYNKASDYNKQIIELLEKNIPVIRKRHKARKQTSVAA
jgi:hypothetical protein